MLTRLIRMQLQLASDGGALEQDLARVFGGPIPDGELARRLSDSMIRSNVFAAAVGALVNPQEATTRIVDGMLQLKDGVIAAAAGSEYDEAVRLAHVDEKDPEYPSSMEKLRRFALEALRLNPQGEVLLRLCVQDTAEVAGVPIKRGTPVFVGYAGAMRDPDAIDRPLTFDIGRDEQLAGYLATRERAREAPQSQVYLQHGYARHKCLGRYASEITMRESLRAVLRLGSLERRSALELDEQKLYAGHLRVAFH
jgi:cytochrome P450